MYGDVTMNHSPRLDKRYNHSPKHLRLFTLRTRTRRGLAPLMRCAEGSAEYIATLSLIVFLFQSIHLVSLR